jgi:abortive infection bacteriophage resistance protein
MRTFSIEICVSEPHFNPKTSKTSSLIAFLPLIICRFQLFVVLLQHQNPPSLFTMLKCAGRFIFIPMANLIPYIKDYKSAPELVKLLQLRGLSISDTNKASHYLQTISYYRLSAYMHPLLVIPKSANQYKVGSSFGQVMMLYRFDKKLRLLLFNEIEKIEIAIRTAIIDECTLIYNDPFWMTDSSNYIVESKFRKTLDLIDHEIAKSHEDFIVHFKNTYSDQYPPAWILSEILPLGVLTNLFLNLNNPQAKKRVALRFGLQLPVFISWVTVITLTRNACCHHARVWNKQNTITPMLPRRTKYTWITLQANPLRIYFDMCIVKYFLAVISPNNDMADKLKALLANYPLVDITAMGFPTNWENEQLWQ